MAVIASVTAGPKGPRDIMLRNLKQVERVMRDFDKDITGSDLLAAVTELLSKDLDLGKKKSKKAE